MINFDKQSFIIDGKREFLVSGDFHYFRVPKSDWKRRLLLFKKKGGKCIGTYAPWIVHEPKEGVFDFTPDTQTDLTSFLQLAKELGLYVMVRPGPMQYSELENDGLPHWLLKDYPQVLAHNKQGESFHFSSISYLHPLLLEKFYRYIDHLSKLILPYSMQNGGPIVMIQLDNEVAGIHEWFGSIDYNKESMGIGVTGGLYTEWLKNKYQTIDQLNEAYSSSFDGFEAVNPCEDNLLIDIDYRDFYCYSLVLFLKLLKQRYESNGFDLLFIHNLGGEDMIYYIADACKELSPNFCIGFDNYYTLGLNGPSNPTVKSFVKALFGCDLLNELNMPAFIPEIQGGSPTHFPPILKENLLALYMINLASGLKGINYYIYTGGQNVPGTGRWGEDYDYNAFISRDGKKKETFKAFAGFNEFVVNNEWIAGSQRRFSVQVGYEWEEMRYKDVINNYEGYPDIDFSVNKLNKMGTSLVSTKYQPKYVELKSRLDLSTPLILCNTNYISKEAESNVLNFVNEGGRLVIFGDLPDKDFRLSQANGLTDIFKNEEFNGYDKNFSYVLANGKKVFGLTFTKSILVKDSSCRILCKDTEGAVLGIERTYGKGAITVITTGAFLPANLDQIDFLEELLSSNGAKEIAYSTNRNIQVSVLSDGKKDMIFAINLYTGEMETDIIYIDNGKTKTKRLKIQGQQVKSFTI